MKCKDFYKILIKKQASEPSCIKKWKETFMEFEKADPMIWKNIFTMAFKCTASTKLQSFQYRIINRIISCNKWLNDITIKSSNLCSVPDCKDIDTISHFFIFCKSTKQFWKSLFNWWNYHNFIQIIDEEALEECILFGFQQKDNDVLMLNYVILHAKHYIYTKKLNEEFNIDFYNFLIKLKYNTKIEYSAWQYKKFVFFGKINKYFIV